MTTANKHTIIAEEEQNNNIRGQDREELTSRRRVE